MVQTKAVRLKLQSEGVETVRNEEELAVLADFVSRPQETREHARYFLVTEASFSDHDCGVVWRNLQAAKSVDQVKLLDIAAKGLGFEKNGAAKDAFLDRASVHVGVIQVRLHDLAMAAYGRQVRAAVATAAATVGDCADGESYEAKIKFAIGDIPKPPKLPCSREEMLAEQDRGAAELPEIPARLLHVPGFIDELVEYSLAAAYKPNRTLSFAGALALLAHLAGRKYFDTRRTRTNLFVLGVAGTGGGKEWLRCVNNDVLQAYRMSPSAQDKIASGEAIEEILWREPCALLQLDEIEHLFEAIADERDANARGKSEYMKSIFTKSATTYTLRPKATAPNEIGRTVNCPSLTLFGTGVCRDVFRALTPKSIHDGFVGRCLIFDTEVEGEDNTFENSPTELPSTVVGAAEEFANIAERQRASPKLEMQFVPYGDGVNDRMNAILKEIRAKKTACTSDGDEVGESIWGRAGEKVSKLALVYAISENMVEPAVSLAGVEWAWELVQTLISRMCTRIDLWMTNGKIDELARRALRFLQKREKAGKQTRRSDVNNAIKPGSMKMMDDVEALLVDRHDITVTRVATNSFVYRLVKKSKNED